jgi:hypothetical protein
MLCRCKGLDSLRGTEAQEYARDHLVELKVDDLNWIVLYRCPGSGLYWKAWYPQSEAHGGGPPELSKIEKERAEREFGLQLD